MEKISQKNLVKISLSILVLSLLLLASFTYAWFTGEVVSSGNIIKTGNLDVSMEFSDGSVDEGEKLIWLDAESEPMFNLLHLEPGYRAVRYLKINNTGNLAFKYDLNILAENSYQVLGDVIDVYLIKGSTDKLTDFNVHFNKVNLVGSLSEVIESKTLASGLIHPLEKRSKDYTLDSGDFDVYGECAEATLVLRMRDNVTNELMDKSIDTNFKISLTATQFSYENDGIDNTYDASANK